MDTNIHTFMQMCMQTPLPPLAATAQCAFIPFVEKKKKMDFQTALRAAVWTVGRVAAKQILLIFFGSRRSRTIVQTS